MTRTAHSAGPASVAMAAAVLLLGMAAGGVARGGEFLDDSAVGLRLGFYDPMNAKDSYDVVYGSGAAQLGVLWDWKWKDQLTFEGEYDYFTKGGERVNLVNGEWVGNGIAEDLTIHSLLVTAKYNFLGAWAVRPFAGGGLGLHSIDVSSPVGGETVTKPGLHVTAGFIMRPESRLSIVGDVRYLLIPSALGDDPNSVSHYYGDSDAGGLALGLSLLYNFGR